MNTDTTFVVRRIPVKAIFKLHKKNGHTDIVNKLCGDFPGGSVAKSLHFKCRGTSLIPSGETGIHMPHGIAKKENKLMVTKEEKRRGMN